MPNKSKFYKFLEKNPKKSVVFFILITVGIIDFSLALILIPDRTDYSSFRARNNYFHHGLLPNKASVHKWGDNIYKIYTNSLGFKDDSINSVDLNREKRIIFMGDSFTEGIGYPYEKTFVGLMDDKLKKDDWDVLNAGVVSYSPKLYYLKTKYLLNLGLKFDHMVVMIDISDIENELDYENYKSDIGSTKEFKIDHVRWFQKRYKHFFKHYSFFYSKFRILKYKLNDFLFKRNGHQDGTMDSWTHNEKVFNEWGKNGMALAKKNMTALVKLLKSRGIKCTIVVYPWPAQIKYDKDLSLQETSWREFSTKQGIDFISLFSYFRKNDNNKTIEQYFIPGDSHWNINGHRVIAKKLFQQLNFN